MAKKQFVLISLRELAARASVSRESIRDAIKRGHLKAVKFVRDETALESKLVNHVPGEFVQGQTLYIMPDEAERFVKAHQQKLAKYVEKPKNITPDLERQILEAAKELKEQNPNGVVERGKILEKISGKKNNMYLYSKIKYVMDQHLEEFPPAPQGTLGLWE